MDVESAEHLERLRDLPQIKVALLRIWVETASEIRFERSARNAHYWPPVDALASDFIATQQPRETCTTIEVYGQPCWLISTLLAPTASSPYVIAITAADDGADLDTLIGRLRQVCHDYWYGSTFFK